MSPLLRIKEGSCRRSKIFKMLSNSRTKVKLELGQYFKVGVLSKGAADALYVKDTVEIIFESQQRECHHIIRDVLHQYFLYKSDYTIQ